MKSNISIQIKAAFLLLIFGLNTIIGFACSVGMDMGFNTVHHHSKGASATSVHVHANGKRHEHHNKATHHHQHDDNKNGREKGGCCNNIVIKFSQTDKSVRQTGLFHPVIFSAVVNSFLIPGIFYQSQVAETQKYFVRGHHPPIPDIRIAIQSFQI